MNAKELRIGNFVKQGIITGIKFNSVDIDVPLSDMIDDNKIYIEEEWFLPDLTPIPLTEEWLLKFSPKEYNKNLYFDLTSQAMLVFNIDTKGVSIQKGTTTIPIICYYVHTFQNIFFCLTGEELTIKE